MNEAIVEKINKLLGLMIDGIEKASSTVQSELPKLVEEFIAMYMIEAFPAGSLVFMLLMFVVATILWFLTRKFSDDDAKHGCRFGIITFAFIISICAGGMVIHGAKEMYKIKNAPKAYLIDRLRK